MNNDLNRELQSAMASLKMQDFKGYAIECPDCKKKGFFGSVIEYKTEKSGNFILCGWCGRITERRNENE